MKIYQTEIPKSLADGTERSLYQPLGNFLERYTKLNFKKEITTIAEQSSKNYEKGVGFPDITIKENSFTLGYIEVKLPTDSIDDKKFKVQFDRYKGSLENIIFTNLKIWQLWQWDKDGNSKKVKEILFDYANPNDEQFEQFWQEFVTFAIIQATTSKQLAINLAKRTKLLSSLLEQNTDNATLQNTKEAFKNALLHDIDDSSFTNLISETFTYSLFIATLEHFNSGKQEELTLTTAVDYIPKTIPVLHDLYELANKLSRELPDIKASVELILRELNSSAIEKIRDSFYKEGNLQEPILYFYETFLREYDKETKKKRGAYYTPKPVVDFIVKSIDTILTEDFSLKEGFLNPAVKVLDPATGTGTFLASAIELIKEKIDGKYQVLGLEKEQFIKEVSNHILHNFYAFEFMIAPYTVAHLKLTLLLKTLGFDFTMTERDDDPDNDRFKIYLANTLDDPNKEPNNLFGFNHIAAESKKAKAVKNQKDIIAIIGNPPYSGSSQNPSEYQLHINKNDRYIQAYRPIFDVQKNLTRLDKTYKLRTKEGFVTQKTWIGEQIEYYKYADGQKLDEKNPKWLQDDYVKFIRFAQYQIESAGFGTIGYIVPHGFLDNPTFRYMRKSLLHSFSKIYILDLHGNDNKKETDLEGNKDENVFDIKQGVCIALFVKKKEMQGCEVYHGDLWGKREEKFHALQTQTFKALCKTKLDPNGEMCYFIPRSEDSEYMSFWSVKDIFKVNTIAIASHRDAIAYHDSLNTLKALLNDFKSMKSNYLREKYSVGKDSRDWQLTNAQESVQKYGISNDYLVKIAYRLFDSKWTYYVEKSKSLLGYPRYDVMKHMLRDNFSLIINKVTKRDTFNTVFIANQLVDLHIMETASASAYVFPLYLYNEDKTSLLEDEKTTNFTDAFVEFKNEKLNGFSDEEIFYYIYGLLYSPTYRARYNEFLKTDFPRIDFGYDIATVSKFGKELTQLHLLTHPIFEEQKRWGLKAEGKNYEVRYAKKSDMYHNGNIYLNPDTHISGVDESTWKFMIGGYQVLEKWLNDRKNTTLNVDELLHYMKIIVSLRETVRVIKEIDVVVEGR